MTFLNEKKNFLTKLDKSKKGDIDRKVISLIENINQKENYYTTSSCSGRVVLWSGTGKKNESEWLKTSHDLIKKDFFKLETKKELVWLRLEPFIIHIACYDLGSANKLLLESKKLYKKSCILSANNKIIVEIRGSESLEMPFYLDGKIMYIGKIDWLTDLINKKLEQIWDKTEQFKELIKKI